MRERPVPCCICRRDTFHDDAVCGRGACVELLAHSKRLIDRRLAAKVIRPASSAEGSGTRLPGPSTFAAVPASHGALQAGDCGISSTGPELGCSPSQVRPGPVDPSGGSTRFPSPDERPSVAPLPHP